MTVPTMSSLNKDNGEWLRFNHEYKPEQSSNYEYPEQRQWRMNVSNHE